MTAKLFNETQLAALRDGYATIQKVDPAGPSYAGMRALLDKMTQAQLKQLAGANIRFLSMLAKNRVR